MARIKSFLPRGDYVSSWLYLLQRSDGVVKLGRTSSPRRRFQQHRLLAADRGQTLARFHLFGAQPRMRAIEAEREALNVLAFAGTRLGTTEEFEGLSFDVALRIVRHSSTQGR